MKKIRDLIRIKETTAIRDRQIPRVLNVTGAVVERYLKSYYANGSDI